MVYALPNISSLFPTEQKKIDESKEVRKCSAYHLPLLFNVSVLVVDFQFGWAKWLKYQLVDLCTTYYLEYTRMWWIHWQRKLARWAWEDRDENEEHNRKPFLLMCVVHTLYYRATCMCCTYSVDWFATAECFGIILCAVCYERILPPQFSQSVSMCLKFSYYSILPRSPFLFLGQQILYVCVCVCEILFMVAPTKRNIIHIP